MRTLTLIITEETAGRTVKSLLHYRLHLPESAITSLKQREGGFLLNGKPCRSIDRVAPGDMLTAQIGDLPRETGMLPCSVTLCIPYEDEDLLILNKPAGMPVHGIAGVPGRTVPNALAAYWGTDKAYHDVNRLDRDTSGLMVIAKNGYSHDRLRRALHTEGFLREYLAVCEGSFPGSCTVESPVDGKTARTDFTLLASGSGYSLLRARLSTGRRHQIRVHCASLGCPLAGDSLYGGHTGEISRPALHSALVSLSHPVTEAQLCITAPLPEDMQALLKQAGIPLPSDK